MKKKYSKPETKIRKIEDEGFMAASEPNIYEGVGDPGVLSKQNNFFNIDNKTNPLQTFGKSKNAWDHQNGRDE